MGEHYYCIGLRSNCCTVRDIFSDYLLVNTVFITNGIILLIRAKFSAIFYRTIHLLDYKDDKAPHLIWANPDS